VLVDDGSGPAPVARWCGRATAGDLPADLCRALTDEGRVVGRLEAHLGRPAREQDRRLLADLADQATLVVRAAGLAAALRARRDLLAATAAELAAGRARLQAGAQLARARLDRDIAAGPGARLAAMRDVLATIGPDRPEAAAGRLVEQADGAIAELREIARGVYPPVLRDSGLAAAVAARYRRSAMRLRLAGEAGELPPDVELVAYLVLTDLLDTRPPADAAAEAQVRLERRAGHLTATVRPAALADHLLVRDRVLASGGGARELPDGGVEVSLPVEAR
jgi:hypothetical protein